MKLIKDQKGMVVPFLPFKLSPFQDRIEAFKNGNKKNHIKTAMGGRDPDLYIRYTKNAFVDLLNKILYEPDNKATNNTGLRVYFACFPENIQPGNNQEIPPNKRGYMTLIFAPTECAVYDDDTKTELKDTGVYYIYISKAAGDEFMPINQDPHDWVNGYETGIRDHLNKYINRHQKETKGLWYKRKTLVETLQSISEENTNYITAAFATYLNDDNASVYYYGEKITPGDYPLSNQLTLVFHTDRTHNFTTLVNLFTHFELMFNPKLAIQYYDTGAPCPPAEGCNGAGL